MARQGAPERPATDMAVLDDLASGKLGLVAAPPPPLTVESQGPMLARFRGPDPDMGFWLLYHPYTHLDLATEHLALPRRDAERTARAMFDNTFAHLAAARPPGNATRAAQPAAVAVALEGQSPQFGGLRGRAAAQWSGSWTPPAGRDGSRSRRASRFRSPSSLEELSAVVRSWRPGV